jgi:MtrB/PioB family decaheme-associated outer membrane protein
MNRIQVHLQYHLRPTLLALALLAAFAPAQADDEIASYITPSSWLSVGVTSIDGNRQNRALWGQYNGMRSGSAFANIDFEYLRREEQSGTWSILQGSDLGLDTRQLRLLQQKQGDWSIGAEYSELTRVYPRTINTGMAGAGTPNPVVTRLAAQGKGSDLDLETRRRSASLSMEKWLTPRLQLEATFKNEDKKGARIFGRGFNCSAAFGCVTAGTSLNTAGAILMLPEPINSTTRQLDMRLNYALDKLFISASYYGSFYDNAYGTLTPTFAGLLYNPNGSSLNPAVVGGNNLASAVNLMGAPMALPPSNQAHQLALTGNYRFSGSTRATFRAARTHATQNEDFAAAGFTTMPAGVTNLGGRIDTTQAQAGVTSRPLSRLYLMANVRYEDKDDKTPIALYSPTAGLTQSDSSLQKLNAKAEASYSITSGLRATLGVDYDDVNHGKPVATYKPGGLNLMREETRETGYRAELRRSMSETLNGSLSYSRSKRDGSGWLNAIAGTPAVTDAQAAALGSNRPVTPVFFMDRDREKVKLSFDWSPIERLSLQVFAEDSKDHYDAPSNGVRKGLDQTGGTLYSIDASFAVSEAWKLNSYVTRTRQSQRINHSLYLANLVSDSDAAGLGFRGKIGKIDVGGELSWVDDDNAYQQQLAVSANTAAVIATNTAFLAAQGGLPNVRFRGTSIKLFGSYAFDKHGSLHLGLTHARNKLNEWTWGYNGVPFFYSDYTTVSMLQNQQVSAVSLNYAYKF